LAYKFLSSFSSRWQFDLVVLRRIPFAQRGVWVNVHCVHSIEFRRRRALWLREDDSAERHGAQHVAYRYDDVVVRLPALRALRNDVSSDIQRLCKQSFASFSSFLLFRFRCIVVVTVLLLLLLLLWTGGIRHSV
jgi:hypothetical protein